VRHPKKHASRRQRCYNATATTITIRAVPENTARNKCEYSQRSRRRFQSSVLIFALAVCIPWSSAKNLAPALVSSSFFNQKRVVGCVINQNTTCAATMRIEGPGFQFHQSRSRQRRAAQGGSRVDELHAFQRNISK
jgi:hypothetical protein